MSASQLYFGCGCIVLFVVYVASALMGVLVMCEVQYVLGLTPDLLDAAEFAPKLHMRVCNTFPTGLLGFFFFFFLLGFLFVFLSVSVS